MVCPLHALCVFMPQRQVMLWQHTPPRAACSTRCFTQCCWPIMHSAFCSGSLLVRLERCCYVGNIAILFHPWLFGMVFCHTVCSSKGPTVLLNILGLFVCFFVFCVFVFVFLSKRFLSSLEFKVFSEPCLLRDVIYVQECSKNVRKLYLAKAYWLELKRLFLRLCFSLCMPFIS